MKKILIIAVMCLIGMGAMAQGKKGKGAEAPVPMYEVKSGIVTMEMDMMGRKIVQEIYFDDYGAKQATIMKFQGKKMRAIDVKGENVMIDDENKTAIKMPAMGMTNEKINFLDKSEKNIKKNKIKELGTEIIAGKECTKYSVAVFMMGQVVKQFVWVYKGITLKTAISTDFGEMGMAATSLVEDVEIPAETFVLPEGIKVQQMSQPPMMGGGF
mgnify:CR=1 FL=1